MLSKIPANMDKINIHKLPVRKPNRLKDYDYSRNGVYFVTICAKNHEEWFGFVGAAICRQSTGHTDNMSPDSPQSLTSDNGLLQTGLFDIGRKIEVAINNIPQVYPEVSVNRYVIMPNHVHLILVIDSNNQVDGRQIAAPTVNSIIGNMKRVVSMQYEFPVWQKSFHDHIIRNKKDYRRIVEYIENNPATWREDCFYGKARATTTPPATKSNQKNATRRGGNLPPVNV